MNLPDYISKVGDETAAKQFNVAVRTAASWRRGERSPKPAKAIEIANITGNQVSVPECFQISVACDETAYAESEGVDIGKNHTCTEVQH